MSLLERRLHVVTGKGGVGKSTLSAALALALQARGRKVLVCEVTAQERVSGLLGAKDSGTEIQQIDRSIWSVHVQPPEAMRQYGLMVLKYRAIYNAVFENRLVRYFLRSIPSLPEIVMLGKVWWHVARERDEQGNFVWDHVVLDAPATGHGLSFLGTPLTILELVSEGPLMRDMRDMQATLVDPQTTAVHVVTLPEEMPVNEAIELDEALRDQLHLPRGRAFLNAFCEKRFDDEERRLLDETTHEELASAAYAGKVWGLRQDLSAHYDERLRNELDLPLTRLPFIASSTFGRAQMEALAKIVGDEMDSV